MWNSSIEALLCQEFLIKDDRKNKKQTNLITKTAVSRQSYNRASIEEAIENRVHEFTFYKSHYFIEEETPFSGYYIKNLHESESYESMFNKEIKDGKVIEGVSKMKSSQLLLLMMKSSSGMANADT